MKIPTILKGLLLRCVPLDHNLKRYFIMKYRHLVIHNGDEYALKKFKDISHYLMSTRSNRPLPCPVRRTGWMKRLEKNFLSHPHWVLNFLKFFNSIGEKKEIQEVSDRFAALLRELNDEPIPKFISSYTSHLKMTKEELVRSYHWNKSDPCGRYHRYCDYHSLREWLQYWGTVHLEWTGQTELGVISTPPLSSLKHTTYQVMPDSYRAVKESEQEESYEVDLFYFLRYLAFNSSLTSEERDYLRSFLSPDGRGHVDRLKRGVLSTFPTPKSLNGAPFGTHFGKIHFVPKAGSDWRPIAVPNRFLQESLEPVHKFLVRVVRRKDQNDASFNQSKFNNVIMSRVNTDDRFVGSIDLKNATERLPLSWFEPMVPILHLDKDPSWLLFKRSAREVWDLNGQRVSWKRGQPLGTLPSFQVLSLTHHLILEALSLEEGYGHRPYRILGDDLVVFTKRLYHRYIREAEKRGLAISYGKSFSGAIAQFAGQTFIKNALPFLTPDWGPVYKTNLFDWSYSTGIRLRWRNLPSTLKRVFGGSKELFELVQTCLVYPRGTTRPNWSAREERLLVYFFASIIDDDIGIHEFGKTLGWILVKGQPTIISNPAKKRDGLFTRYRSTSTPNWFKDKFRPTSVDKALNIVRDWSMAH